MASIKRKSLTVMVHGMHPTLWRYKGLEVDFVIKTPKQIWGMEVKSGKPENPKGVSAFLKHYPEARMMIVGSQGMALEEFFRTDPRRLF